MQKRFDQDDERDLTNELTAAETARSAAESAAGVKSGATGDEKVSLFWRVFGGTILSIVALISITLYNSITSNITELRNELNREREARAELVKKDEFNSRTTSQYERMRSFEGLKAEHEGLKERVNNNASVVEGLKKDSGVNLDALRKETVAATDLIKKDAAAIEVLKERVAALEPLKKDVAGVELLKERLTTTAADLKSVRDELGKLQQEIDRNKVGDLERKAQRDAQHKQVEESLKELQKGLQVCREKLARLEGSQPVTPARGTLIPFEPAGPPAPAKPTPPPGEDD